MSTEQNRAWRKHTAALIESGELTPESPAEKRTQRWTAARIGAGLNVAQAAGQSSAINWEQDRLHAVEVGWDPHEMIGAWAFRVAAHLYNVTECYLRGHAVEPSDALADAVTSAPGAGEKDLQALAELLASQAECPDCAAGKE